MRAREGSPVAESVVVPLPKRWFMTMLCGFTRRVFVVGFFAISALIPMAVARVEAQGQPAIVERYADVLRSFNPELSLARSQDMAQHVLLLASYYNLDPRLLVAIVSVESSWNAGAISPAGAQGLGQLMPATAERLAVQTFEAYENLDGTARYLRRLLAHFGRLQSDTRYALAIAGYNAGPEAVRKYGGIPPYAETRNYVVRVTSLWHRLQGSLPGNAYASIAIAHAPKRGIVTPGGSVADFVRLDTLPLSSKAAVAYAPVAPLDPPRNMARALEAEAVWSAPRAPRSRPQKVKPLVLIALARPALAAQTRPIDVAMREVIPLGPSHVVSIALSAPATVAEGKPIPVSLRVRGIGNVKLIAKIGPTVIQQLWVPANARHVALHKLPKTGRTRIVTLRALSDGARSLETIVVSVPRRTI